MVKRRDSTSKKPVFGPVVTVSRLTNGSDIHQMPHVGFKRSIPLAKRNLFRDPIPMNISDQIMGMPHKTNLF